MKPKCSATVSPFASTAWTPKPAGPGFPREPPSIWITSSGAVCVIGESREGVSARDSRGEQRFDGALGRRRVEVHDARARRARNDPVVVLHVDEDLRAQLHVAHAAGPVLRFGERGSAGLEDARVFGEQFGAKRRDLLLAKRRHVGALSLRRLDLSVDDLDLVAARRLDSLESGLFGLDLRL